MSDQVLAQALSLHQQGKLGQALVLYQKALQANPRSPDTLHLLGVALHQAGRSEQSVALVRAAISLRPDSAIFHNNFGLILRDQMKLSEALEAFQEAVRLDPLHIEAVQNTARIQTLTGRAESALRSGRKAAILHPGGGENPVLIGNAFRTLGAQEPAARAYTQALMIDRGRIEAWVKRGALHAWSEDDVRSKRASQDLMRAACLGPDRADPSAFLGFWLLALQRFLDADRWFKRAIMIEPGHMVAHSGRAEVAMAQGDAKSAARHSGRVSPNKSTDPHIRFRHGIHLLANGETEEGWSEYDFIYRKGDAVLRAGLPGRWDGTDLRGKRLLVCAEQGVGDELLFTAHLREAVRGADKVILECDARVVSLFQRSFPETWVHSYKRGNLNGRPVQKYDWIPRDLRPDVFVEAGRLFAQYHRSVAEADAGAHAWLQPDPARVEEMRSWLDRLGPGPKIGVAWQSMKMTPLRRPHYPGLSKLGPLLTEPGARFVALQYGTGWRAELKESGHEVEVLDELDTTDDLEGVTALVSQLDLIIAPSSTLVWIACGTGRPMWMLYNHPIFLNLGLDRFPGFPTLRGFSKPLLEPWDDAVDQTRAALHAWIQDWHRENPI
jgi:tetratricopeptide (TPR) repeat protein